MTEQRKADVEAKLGELEYEIALAIRQGAIKETLTWMATFSGPAETTREEHWFAVLTVGEV